MKSNTTFLLILGCIAMIILAILFAMKIQKNSVASIRKENNISNTKQSSLETKESDEADVIVTATPEMLKVREKPKFKLVFDTHSVNLDFDVSQLVVLTDDEGSKYADAIWEGSPPGGHHRDGVITFNEELKETSKIELAITDVAGIKERVFEWKL